ncbi:MAG: FeoB-associated Cys-rich membrane protein [Clostridia bacterium]|nr:FeoB-associated Cys-rich membrane protein [Clostridia bacterium]
MTFIDYLIIGLVLAVVALSVVITVRNKKKGKTSCGCDCGHCNGCGVKKDNSSSNNEQ